MWSLFRRADVGQRSLIAKGKLTRDVALGLPGLSRVQPRSARASRPRRVGDRSIAHETSSTGGLSVQNEIY